MCWQLQSRSVSIFSTWKTCGDIRRVLTVEFLFFKLWFMYFLSTVWLETCPGTGYILHIQRLCNGTQWSFIYAYTSWTKHCKIHIPSFNQWADTEPSLHALFMQTLENVKMKHSHDNIVYCIDPNLMHQNIMQIQLFKRILLPKKCMNYSTIWNAVMTGDAIWIQFAYLAHFLE
jgi:hypothetical protein